jgi:hypothetical protein
MSWMSRLPDGRLLNQIVMPGSHDAGLYEVTKMAGAGKMGGNSRIKTQSLTIKGQLEAGSRFFDLRVYKRKDKNELYLGHFAERDWRLVGAKARKGHHDHGGYGPSLRHVLTDIINFMQGGEALKEAVILRFSHIKKKFARTVVDEVRTTLGSYLYKTTNPFGAIVAQLTLGEVRRKVIATFDAKNFVDEIDPLKGIHSFTKYGGGAAVGLVTCGEYGKTDKLNKLKVDQAEKINEHHKHYNTRDDHLGMCYWQLTGGNIEQNTERYAKPAINTYLRGLLRKGITNPFSPGINIVGFDFVDPAHCQQIYDLNFI